MAEEVSLRRMLRTALRDSGFAVEEFCSAPETTQSLRRRKVDLTILDIDKMPGSAGIMLCREVRALGQSMGILLLAASDFEKSIVQAFEAGADDYIAKPFRAGELIGRCHVVLRRISGPNTVAPTSITAGELELNLARREFRRAGKLVHLTPTEFNLLELLMKHRGRAVSHVEILRSIWGPEYGKELEYLRSYIRLLRKKIEPDPAQPKYLLTEPWMGYRFCVPSNSDHVA